MDKVMVQHPGGPWRLCETRLVVLRGPDGEMQPYWIFTHDNSAGKKTDPTFVGIRKAAREGNLMPDPDTLVWGALPEFRHNNQIQDIGTNAPNPDL